MDTQTVIEFLGCVALIRRLTKSSIREIAQLVTFKHYDGGEYIVCKGERGDEVYFIWEGEAEVSGPINNEVQDPNEFVFNRYDYFGQGMASIHQVNVIALSKVTCLVLPFKHCSLLQPKMFWTGDGTRMEHILNVERIEANKFKGITLPDAPRFGSVFGGQIVAQAITAAKQCIDNDRIINSLHSFFLFPGDVDLPIIYEVHRIRDGKSFASRKVEARQNGELIFVMLASFQKEESGFHHQVVTMPCVPEPESLLSMEEKRERRILDPRICKSYRQAKAMKEYIPLPVDVKFCEPSHFTSQYIKAPPRLKYWFKSKGKLSDDQAIHRGVVAFTSDLMFIPVSLKPHRVFGLKQFASSLEHSVCFHRSVKADDWILFEIESPIAHSGRGFVRGQMFNRKGELLVSLTQEGVIRQVRTPQIVAPKL